MSSVCVYLSLTILSNYCLVNFIFDCSTSFRIEIASYYYDVSVADVSENAVKFGIKVSLIPWFFSLLFSVGAYSLKMSTFKLLLTFILLYRFFCIWDHILRLYQMVGWCQLSFLTYFYCRNNKVCRFYRYLMLVSLFHVL